MDVGEQLLAPVLDPFNGLAEMPCQSNGNELFRIDLRLSAEATTDFGNDDTELRFLDTGILGQRSSQQVRNLRRRIEQ